MMPRIIEFAREVREAFSIVPGDVLEVGSLDVNGSTREVFATGAASYVGVDLVPGPGVDVVMDGRGVVEMFGERSFDTVVCTECIEHDPRPWEVLAAVKKVLRPGGVLFVSAHTYGFPYHGYPKDYYRFSEDAFREWAFAGCEVLRLEVARDEREWPCLVGVGRLS